MLKVFTDYDNGSARVLGTDDSKHEVTIAPADINNACRLHINVLIKGITPGKPLRINVKEIHKPAGEVNMVYSYDGITWHRTKSERSPYIEVFTKDSVYVSRNIPYPYGKVLDLSSHIKKCKYVEVKKTCDSEEGRKVLTFRFTDPETKDTGKKLFWIQARQHAFESHSSIVADALARWFVFDKSARNLLKKAVIYVTPIMDVDNVYNGGSGKNQKPKDLNRDWCENPHWNVVRAAIKLINNETAGYTFKAFVDMHSPWYYELHHWHILNCQNRKDIDNFCGIFENKVEDIGGDNSWKNAYQLHDISKKDCISSHYAHMKWASKESGAVSISMEISHWKDNNGKFITKKGLQDFGKAMGLTLAEIAGLIN
jgi:hypothetical protein